MTLYKTTIGLFAKRILGFVCTFLFFLTIACGGGGGSKTIDPTLTTGGDFSVEPENTLQNGITVNPESIDMGVTTQKKSIVKKFTLTNGSGRDVTFSLIIMGNAGGYHFFQTDKTLVGMLSAEAIKRGESKEYSVAFDALTMGSKTAYVQIEAQGIAGHIILPLKGRVSGAADYKIITSDYLCSSETAPTLSTLDFMKVLSGKTVTKGVKICNTGGQDIILNDAALKPNKTGAESESVDVDFEKDFVWEVEEELNTVFFDYYNPDVTESFEEPTFVTYTGPAPDAVGAFTIKENSTGRLPKNLVIPAGNYMLLDITFAPSITTQPPEGSLFLPVNYATTLEVSTSLGVESFNVLGSSGGREPELTASYTFEGSTFDTDNILDLRSDYSAINFGIADIYKDWIIEDANHVNLTLKNTGTGTTPLKVWLDEITTGYFTFEEQNPAVNFPILLQPGQSKTVSLIYAPTPEVVSPYYDLGQLKIHQNGTNGPTNLVTLLGQEKSQNSVELSQGGILKIKPYDAINPPYPVDSPKSLCIATIGTVTTKSFTIKNYSKNYPLTSDIRLSSMGDKNGRAIKNVAITLDQTHLVTDPQSESTFSINVDVKTGVKENVDIYGKLDVTNHFDQATERQFGVSPAQYSLYFKLVSSKATQCTGGDGTPVTGNAWYVVDRLTLNLGGVSEPLRDHTAYRSQIPVELDSTGRWARLKGIKYDPRADTKTIPSVKLFRAYNHQITSVASGASCFPLGTNPYKAEYEPGSWMSDKGRCKYDNDSENIHIDGSEICMFNNNSQKLDAADPNSDDVFYHEFVKFNPDSCEVEFEGKIATFYLAHNETAQQAYDRVASKVGDSGTAEQYQAEMKTYQNGSYITFKKAYDKNGCKANANETLTDADKIKTCWESFKGQDWKSDEDPGLTRVGGMVEECAYFYFTLDEGCVPQDAPVGPDYDGLSRCTDSNIKWSKPDTWTSFGEYEPHRKYTVDDKGNVSYEEDDTRWDLTMRNIRLELSILSSSLNNFFDNNTKLANLSLYLTFTSKAIGLDEDNPTKFSKDLIAVNVRDDFSQDKVMLNKNDSGTKGYFTENPINSNLNTGDNDDQPCDEMPALSSCKGNFIFTPSQKMVVAGEPIDFLNRNRAMIAGVTAFHGKNQLAPVFARESSSGDGVGLTFSTHGCLVADPDNTGIDERTGCYDWHWDDEEAQQKYVEAGILDEVKTGVVDESNIDECKQSAACIDYIIFEQDRQRFTNYYDYPKHQDFGAPTFYKAACGDGM
ncbi:choice-of-anchor D domain-containing protein [bacterium]|nr:choice-of-anchor D domain-containing protein [bacterium]